MNVTGYLISRDEAVQEGQYRLSYLEMGQSRDLGTFELAMITQAIQSDMSQSQQANTNPYTQNDQAAAASGASDSFGESFAVKILDQIGK